MQSLVILFLSFLPVIVNPAAAIDNSLIKIAEGQQPQLAIDRNGELRMVFGNKDIIYYTRYNKKTNTFSKPVEIAKVPGMHLGMTRGPQLASSRSYSIVTAIDKSGVIYSFSLNHKTDQWLKLSIVNDVKGSAEEGLMSITADDEDNFYAVGLDLRGNRQNKIALASLRKDGAWTKSKILYTSPDGTVCECCKPSIAVQGKAVSVMFRNWLGGSRDLYIISSTDNGKTFDVAQKLGKGTWKLKGCPMDGGGILIDQKNNVHSVWQRDGNVYYSQPGQNEIFISNGRSCNIGGNSDILMSWENGSQLHLMSMKGNKYEIGEGTALSVAQTDASTILTAWEMNKEIYFKKFKP